ncbi:MBL fold metallo-hydrolase [Acidothermaceae bacterium B102]|nr:MBL fold metallo-hydrolase [Acidothermaceae bacterium B102]
MNLTHLGHACLLVETDRARVLVDPGTMSGFDDVRDLEAVLVTHQHPDHVDLPRLAALLAANPAATLVVDADTSGMLAGDTAATLADLPAHVVARTGDRLTFAGLTIDVLGGLHAAVYADVPGCTNAAYLFDDGALLHPGDSFFVPDRDIDVLAVAVDGPWLKLAEAVDYVHAVSPRVAVPIHEGETTDPAKYAGMLAAFSPAGVVQRLTRDQPTTL